jgi:type II secretory pathway pseudopilin PulG
MDSLPAVPCEFAPASVKSKMHRARAFTLIEIAISCFILMLIMLLAIPSVEGVLANRRLQSSLDALNNLVRQAQEHSVAERRPYLIIWEQKDIIVRPEAVDPGSNGVPLATLNLSRGQAYHLRLTASLQKNPPAQWIFWPTGTCEPATVDFKGPDGSWEVNYTPLTARPEIVRYATR